jgi:hypothetical protein
MSMNSQRQAYCKRNPEQTHVMKYRLELNFAVEWLTPFLPIRQNLFSNIDPEIGYPD